MRLTHCFQKGLIGERSSARGDGRTCWACEGVRHLSSRLPEVVRVTASSLAKKERSDAEGQKRKAVYPACC